ncbi:hypothetical protein BG011_001945 [Mortierella polycephala]|uniref:C2 domain-containing protein n=1 Tax=Mortierella polycephala TaxID=41804 RepID=A0A9P6Q4A8_9FUNG|nr:hypothetical protein BG011_001945 [Mortierella polycephala]
MRFSTIIAALFAPALVMAAVIEPKAEVNVESVPIHAMAGKSGQLYVKLNHATNLRNKDFVGRSDVFVEMWLEKSYRQRSKEVKGPNPVFDETFLFTVRSGQNKLYIRVVDKDTFSNDKIGEATVSLDAVMANGSAGPMDVKLPRWFGLRDNGSVNIQLRFVEGKS